jgi:hypothetical protein
VDVYKIFFSFIKVSNSCVFTGGKAGVCGSEYNLRSTIQILVTKRSLKDTMGKIKLDDCNGFILCKDKARFIADHSK